MRRKRRTLFREAGVGIVIVGAAYLATRSQPFGALAAARIPADAAAPDPIPDPAVPAEPIASDDAHAEPLASVAATDAPTLASTTHPDPIQPDPSPPDPDPGAAASAEPTAPAPDQPGAITANPARPAFDPSLPDAQRTPAGRRPRPAMNFRTSREGTYVMQRSLDAGPDPTELGWVFVCEDGHEGFLTVETDAEVAVSIDGKPVTEATRDTIDEQPAAGADDLIDFDIINGVVVPRRPFTAEVTIVSAAYEDMPITTMLRIGPDTLEPFGPLDDPVAGNIDDGANPRTSSRSELHPARSPVSLVARGWFKFWGSTKERMTADPARDSPQVHVLRDGDPLPDTRPSRKQAAIDAELRRYLDPDSGLVTLAPNQVIYLYELEATDPTDPTADYRDLVAVVTLAADQSTPTPVAATPGTPTNDHATTIDLSRLGWLEINRPHRVQVICTNRTGAPADLRIETNLRPRNDR